MIKVLNLYCGIGGNRKNWPNDKIEVTAIELNPKIAKIYQDFFLKDKVLVTDANAYLLEHFKEFDFIWSSPPCQSHSMMVKWNRHEIIKYPEMNLYQEIIFLKHFFKGKFVVENVKPYYKPLIKPRGIGRHCFWSNFIISDFNLKTPDDFTNTSKEVLMDWLGLHFKDNIYYEGNHDPCQILRNCVHPKLGLHVFKAAFKDQQTRLNSANHNR